jgi:hypothetical protein
MKNSIRPGLSHDLLGVRQVMTTGTNAAARRLVRCITGTRVYVITEGLSAESG